ncbi:hypothetical protein Bca4012_026475 [Brassica carinata]
MKPFSSKSANCCFNSASSAGAIRYGAFAIAADPGSKVILKGLFLDGGNTSNALNTSSYSRTTGMSSKFCSFSSSIFPATKVTRYTSSLRSRRFSTLKAETSDTPTLGTMPW